MTDTSTAGWYPDPEGRPGLQRWWNGLGWSESVRAAPGSGATLTAAQRPAPYETRSESSYEMPSTAPYETPHEMPYETPYEVAGVADPGYQMAPPTDPAGPPRRRVRPAAWGWIAGVAALALVLTLVVFAGGSQDPDPPVGAGTGPPIPTRPPGVTRIVDEAAGVAYPYLGTYWMEYVNEIAETTSTTGQYIVTQELTPDGGQFIAQVTSGPLRPDFGYAGPSSFPGTIIAVQDSVRAAYYPAPNEIEALRDEALTVDGAPAHLLEFNLTWDVAGYESTGERAALLLIETGRAAPALIYISIPNTHAELYGVVDRVIAEIDVLS